MNASISASQPINPPITTKKIPPQCIFTKIAKLAQKEKFSVHTFRSISEISPEVWDNLTIDKSIFLRRSYLHSLETQKCDNMCVRYVLFTDMGKPVGVGYFQITDFTGGPIESILTSKSPITSFLAGRLKLTRKPFKFRLMVCGNSFTTGEHGFAFLPETDVQKAVYSLVLAAGMIRKELETDQEVTGILFKDFYAESDPYGQYLKDLFYSDCHSEENMILTLDERWSNFDDYLNDLSSKFRVKAKRAYTKSSALREQNLTAAEILLYSAEIEQLYMQVHHRAGYALGKIDIDVFVNLRETMDNNFVMRGYFLGDQLVGFLTGFVDGKGLEAHLVGFEYKLNRAHSIYSRILYDYLKIAIDKGLNRINYGRTAGEIKSTIGAVPIKMNCYLRHRRCSFNTLLPLIGKFIRPVSSPIRKPFKQAWYASYKPQPALAVHTPDENILN